MSQDHKEKIDRLLEEMARPSALKHLMGAEMSVDELRQVYASNATFRVAIDFDAWRDAPTSKAIH